MFWKVPLLRFENAMLCRLDYKTIISKLFRHYMPGIGRTVKVSAFSTLTMNPIHYRADKNNPSSPALSCFYFCISDSSVICQVRILFVGL